MGLYVLAVLMQSQVGETYYQYVKFGHIFGRPTHTFICVVHSTEARSLQVVPRCEGD